MNKFILGTYFLFISYWSFGQDQSSTGLQLSDSTTYVNLYFPILPKVTFGTGVKEFFLDGFPPVKAQGEVGSCASWSTGYYLMGYYNRKVKNFDSYFLNNDIQLDKIFNPLYVHNQIKFCKNSCLNCGTSNFHALDFLTNNGIVTYQDFNLGSEPDDEKCLIIPDQSLKAKARLNTFKNYSSLINPYVKYVKGQKFELIKNALLQGFPVIISIPVDESFKHAYLSKKFIWRTFSGNSSSAEFHSMVCIGFSETLNAIKIINSWSDHWGDSGYGWIDIDLFDKYLAEAFIVNVPNNFLISNNSVFNTDHNAINHKIENYNTSDTTNSIIAPDFEIGKPIQSYCINKRYQQFDDVRVYPFEISSESSRIKFYLKENNNYVLIDIVSLNIGELYNFKVEDRSFSFKLNNIKPSVFLGSKAIYFTITQIK